MHDIFTNGLEHGYMHEKWLEIVNFLNCFSFGDENYSCPRKHPVYTYYTLHLTLYIKLTFDRILHGLAESLLCHLQYQNNSTDFNLAQITRTITYPPR